MDIAIIKTGRTPNDGTGDTTRDAWAKQNANNAAFQAGIDGVRASAAASADVASAAASKAAQAVADIGTRVRMQGQRKRDTDYTALATDTYVDLYDLTASRRLACRVRRSFVATVLRRRRVRRLFAGDRDHGRRVRVGYDRGTADRHDDRALPEAGLSFERGEPMDFRLMRGFLAIVCMLVGFGAAPAPARADQILGTPRLDGAGHILLPSGPTLGLWQGSKYTATPDQITVPGTVGYWADNTVPANILRFNDRVLVGLAAGWNGQKGTNGTDWTWTVGRGIYSYLPRIAGMSVVNPYGNVAGFFATRTSDTAAVPGSPNFAVPIALATFVANDNTANPIAAWNYYGTGFRRAGTGDTHNIELDILNASSEVIDAPVYGNSPVGQTLGIALNSGGEGADYNSASLGGQTPFPATGPSSAAWQIASNGTAFRKGGVVKSASIQPRSDSTTSVLDMPANYGPRWVFDASDATGAYITSTVGQAANANTMFFTDFGPVFRNVSGTETYAQISRVTGAVNYPRLTPAVAGAAVRVEAAGSDTNVSVQVSSKGTGNINLQAPAVSFIGTGGSCTITPPSTTLSCSSDERLKRDIVDTTVAALAEITDFRVRDFTLRADGSRHTGVIAQEVRAIHPEMVHENEDGMLRVDAPNPWVLVKAIQDLQARQTAMAWIIAALALWSAGLSVVLVRQGRRMATTNLGSIQ